MRSHSSAMAGGMGAPATAVRRAWERSVLFRSGLWSIRMTLVGTPTSMVAWWVAASLNSVSGVGLASCSMISAAPRRRQKRHIPPMPWVSGDMTSTRSAWVTCRRVVKPSKVACLSLAESEASFGRPVVPDVKAISTIRRWRLGAGAGPW